MVYTKIYIILSKSQVKNAKIAYTISMNKLPTPTAEKLPSTWKGFNLLNMFYKRDKDRNSEFDEKDFVMMSQWGFSFARIPIDYRILIKSDDWHNMNEDSMRHLDKLIEYGKKYNVHICLNLHRAPGYTVARPPEKTNLWTEKEPQEAFCRMWGFFAQRYKDVPNENLSFNFVNEPHDVDEAPYAAVIKMAAEAIRAQDTKRLMIADGLNWGREPSPIIKKLGIAQAGRGYEPHRLTHYKASWVEGSEDYPVPVWPNGSDMTKEKLWETDFNAWKKIMESGCGVIIGEWGCHNRTPHEVVLKWMEDNLQIYKEAGIGWALWNLKGSFGVLDSGRTDVDYEDFNGHKLDRKMLDLLLKYLH
jgi:endoglucanase